MIETKPTTRTHKVLSRDADCKEVIFETKVTDTVLVFPLAQNVSEHNVNRMAARWMP
jgi:hypothetical protein